MTSARISSLYDDLTDYGIEVSNHTYKGNSLIYHPTSRIRNYILLDLVRRNISSENGHVLIIAPSPYDVKQHSSFLKRNLEAISIGSEEGEHHDGLWPKVIVIAISNLLNVFCPNLNFKLKTILVLECQDALHHDAVKLLMTHVKDLKLENQPALHCFTSCFTSPSSKSDSMRQCICDLEEFYGCKLVSTCDQNVVERIFPVPNQLLSLYDLQDSLNESCLEALQLLNFAEDLCSKFNFHLNERFSQEYNTSGEMFVKRVLSEVQEQMEELGEYGGSIAALAAFRHLVCLYTYIDSSPGHATKQMIGYLVCTLSKFRKILEEDMIRKQLCERAEHFSSKKIQLLLNYLCEMPESHRALIIVQHSNTASNLALILQKIISQGRKHNHLKCELMINSSSIPASDSWEDTLAWERNMEVYSRFVAGKTNTVVLCGELQGLDMPQCDIVVVMDKIQDLSLFLQVTNMAKRNQLIFLADKANHLVYERQINQFESTVEELRDITTADSKSCSDHVRLTNVFKTPSETEINGELAKIILYRYCSMLPSDELTPHRPVWKMKKYLEDVTLYRTSLFLPRVCPINKIKSCKTTSWESAQQDAAIKACQRLYKLKEIDDAMLDAVCDTDSKRIYCMTKNPSNLEDFMTNMEKELGLNSASLCKTKSQDDEDILCNITYPLSLACAQPKPDKEVFLHKLKIWPVSERPPCGDNRKTVLYELLCDESSFAILSTKPLPQVCQFPIFMFGHELSVDIVTNDRRLKLKSDEIIRLRKFHCGLFLNILPLVQQFMQFDVFNSQNSFLIAPLTPDGVIDWTTVDNHVSLPDCQEPSHEEKANLVCSHETHERTIVKPWYRFLCPDQVYLVSTVCTDMSAESCFPTPDFETFLDYFKEKYKILLERPELPLLEVYLLNTKANGLLPRTLSHKMRRDEKMEQFRELMVPELCVSLMFPAAYWLKLSCLPSALHRLSRLLVVEEFRQLLHTEAGAGPQDIRLERLKVDPFSLKNPIHVPEAPPPAVKRGLAIGNVKLEDRKRIDQLKKPWQGTQEPLDIYRHMELFNFVEIRYFYEFLTESRVRYSSQISHSLVSDSDIQSEPDSWSCKMLFPHDGFTLLKPYCDDHIGPQQYELLEVFTSASSGDVVNMDRIQVLGNAFLKLAISVYSYKYGASTPGSLTLPCLYEVRSEFLTQSNLEDCAESKGLCGRLKVLDFTPGEWIPPCFVTPPWLKEVLVEQEISPNVLQQVVLTEEEKLSGIFNEDSQEYILDLLINFVNRGEDRREEVYIDRQHVTRQTAASCVEALVGTYFKNCGWHGALKVIGWLGLLPSSKLQGLLDSDEIPNETSVSSHFAYLLSKTPVSLESLEFNLQYTFNNKTLLVQAVTHESYINPEFQGSMGMLAFLGTGILDFLITSFMFDKYVSVDASQLERLREILTCTSTLAFLAVRFEMHKHLLSNSCSLMDAIDRFVKNQKGCQHSINDEVQLLLEEHECESDLQIEVPDALAKLIPALVGAVYLDSSKNLKVTWDVFGTIFIPWIEKWSQDVPLAIVDLLKDLSPAAHQVLFSTTADQQGRKAVTCRVQMDNTREEVFIAHGSDEIKTKTHAAKLALRNLLGLQSFRS